LPSVRKLAPLLVLAATLGLTAPAGGAGEKTYLPGCVPAEKAKYKPRTIVVACADANFQIRKIEWSHWGDRGAKGTGKAKVNTCDPSCAEGKFKTYPVIVRAGHPHQCEDFGRREWKRLYWRFTDDKPKGFDRRDSQRRACTA
jgi:hypothetical protein